jgi:hypothetical protein
LIVARSGSIRKSTQILKRGRVETLGGEPPDGLGSPPARVEKPSSPLRLRVEDRQGIVDDLSRESFPFQGEADGSVSEAPAGKLLGPSGADPSVVDEPCPLEGLECVFDRGGAGAALREPRLQAAAGVIAVTKRAQCDTKRLRPS